MNLFSTTTTRSSAGPATPARVAERECKSASRMVAHGPRLCNGNEKHDISEYVRPDNVRSTGSEVVYHYAPARKVTFERAEIDHLPPRPDLLLSPTRLSSAPFSPPFVEAHFHNRIDNIARVAEYSRPKSKKHSRIKFCQLMRRREDGRTLNFNLIKLTEGDIRRGETKKRRFVSKSVRTSSLLWHHNFSTWGTLYALSKL